MYKILHIPTGEFLRWRLRGSSKELRRLNPPTDLPFLGSYIADFRLWEEANKELHRLIINSYIKKSGQRSFDAAEFEIVEDNTCV